MALVTRLVEIADWEALWADLARPDVPPVLIFKQSPRCPISFAAQDRFDRFAESYGGAVRLFRVDVVAERAIARRIALDTGVPHESPQALLLGGGRHVSWHDSHSSITEAALNAVLSAGI